ncbi:MAG: hypothetical protein Fur0042_20370 [Cyanophyceae cyanobacterium]
MSENVSIVIDFRGADRDDVLLEHQTQTLFLDLQRLDEIAAVERVADPNPPEGNFSGGGWLLGLLKAEVSAQNAGKLFGWLQQKFGKQPIAIKVKGPYGGEYEIAVKNPDDFERAARVAQKLALGEPLDGLDGPK